MKILVVILIIILIVIIIFNSNIYFSEDFISESSFNQNTIDDLISISYIPYNPNEKEKLNEYEVIDIYKKILIRSPTDEELKEKIFMSKIDLTEFLYNSFEYDKISKLQTISADSNMESSIAKRNLTSKIYDIYKSIYRKDIPTRMVVPLRDCYIHLRSNYYLFLVFLENSNYPKFEKAVLSTITLSKKILLELFNLHFNLLELKLKAEDKIKAGKGITINTNINKIKSELDNITKANITTDNLSELKKYLNSDTNIQPLELKETYTNSSDDTNELSKLLKVREHEKITDIKTLPKNSEVYVRVYNPINYKQTYKGPAEYKPPICTSLGQPSLEVPVYPESRLLFQSADLDKAFEYSQVGSIMPKFEYREYQDIRIQ
jgi:hypothetical protein